MATMKCDMAGAAAVVAATFAIAALGLPVRVTRTRRWPRTCRRARHAARRRADDVRRQDRRGAQHRRRGPAGARRRAGAGHRGRARPDRRRGHPDRRLRDRARRPGGRRVRQRRRARRADDRGGRAAAGETLWPLPIAAGDDREGAHLQQGRRPDAAQHRACTGGALLRRGASSASSSASTAWAHLDIAGPAFNNGGPYGHVTTRRHRLHGRRTLVELAADLAT